MLMARGVDGILAIDTKLPAKMPLPTVSVAGHATIADVTNVMLDHHKAAQLALGHLHELGHRRIAFMQGAAIQFRFAEPVAVDAAGGAVARAGGFRRS